MTEQEYRDFWGWHYFTERSAGKQVANFWGHFGIGFGPAAAWAALACWAVPFLPIWTAAFWGTLAMSIREIVQYADNGKLHLADRTRDVLEGTIGGVVAFVVFRYAIPACQGG